MRTRQCTLIGTATCEGVFKVQLTLAGDMEGYVLDSQFATADLYRQYVNKFARDDGFKDWRELKAFWADEHPGLEVFDGVLITWKDFKRAGVAPGISPGFDAALRRGKARRTGYRVR